MGAEKAKKAETEKAKKPEKSKAAAEANAKPAKKAKQAEVAEQSQAAAEKFAVASGLAAVFGALNLNEDVRVQCLARTVQWFQELGVRLAGAATPLAVERTQSNRAECSRDP